MKTNYVLDYISCICLKLLGPVLRFLPLGVSLFIGKSIGNILYILDRKHRAIVYANVKRALSSELSCQEISRITRKFYTNIGQSLIEIFLFPLIDKKYMDKYVEIEGRDNPKEAFRKGKGVILVAMHTGNWELSSIVCANLGFSFNLLVGDQRLPRLNDLLNFYRINKGYKILERQNQTRQLIKVLRANEAIGITVDQGGKGGQIVKFFGKEASMSTGAIKMALKYGSVILPAFYTRINGPYQKVIIGKPLEISVTGDLETDVRDNLQRLISHYEGLIRKYPEEYLWTYKVWKYGRQKDILILSDGRPGHLRQSEAVGNIVSAIYSEKGIKADISILKVEFKSRLAAKLLGIGCCFSGKYNCQGCLWCLRHALTEPGYKNLIAAKPDIVISAGSSLAPVNYILCRQNLAKSIVLMRPGYLSARRFDLVVMPYHDRRILHKNVVTTQGALNLIDTEYLKKQSQEFMDALSSKDGRVCFLHEPIGLLVGGNSKGFVLSLNALKEVTKQLKTALDRINNDILITTSRRTSAEIEGLLEKEFSGYPLCKKLIIANKENPPFAVGGIMGLAWLLVVSPESISMISEAVTSGRQVLVIDLPGLSKKHRRFLDNFAKEKYISLVKPEGLAEAVQNARRIKTPARILNDNEMVKEALKKTL